MPPLRISPATARRFLRRALLLDAPAPDVATALEHHGYIQIDPLNVCGRMHDLILRNRVAAYREGDLLNHIHSAARPGFEHYLPHAGILVAFPAAAWPYVAPFAWRGGAGTNPGRRAGRDGAKLSPNHERLAQHILTEIATRGPLTSDDIEHEGRSVTGWGSPGRLVKNLLEVLFVHGRVLITARRNFRRVYDLPERVLPPAMLNAPTKSAEEIARWTALLRLRQRRLAALKRGEYVLVADLVQQVLIDGVKTPPLYVLRSDLALLLSLAHWTDDPAQRVGLTVPVSRASSGNHGGSPGTVPTCQTEARASIELCSSSDHSTINSFAGQSPRRRPADDPWAASTRQQGTPGWPLCPGAGRRTNPGCPVGRNREPATVQLSTPVALLAPLDPLIYDRRVTAALWNFDYTWEVYTPEHKRQRGYYALPVLAGMEIVGHVDPKADRAAKKLRIISRSVKRGHRVAPAVDELARWLGLRR